jgi:hypothetical protein
VLDHIQSDHRIEFIPSKPIRRRLVGERELFYYDLWSESETVSKSLTVIGVGIGEYQ